MALCVCWRSTEQTVETIATRFDKNIFWMLKDVDTEVIFLLFQILIFLRIRPNADICYYFYTNNFRKNVRMKYH